MPCLASFANRTGSAVRASHRGSGLPASTCVHRHLAASLVREGAWCLQGVAWHQGCAGLQPSLLCHYRQQKSTNRKYEAQQSRGLGDPPLPHPPGRLARSECEGRGGARQLHGECMLLPPPGSRLALPSIPPVRLAHLPGLPRRRVQHTASVHCESPPASGSCRGGGQEEGGSATLA